jgi:hypothetical protein
MNNKVQQSAMNSVKTNAVGVGMYSTVSFFNHSCDPSVTRDFLGVEGIFRALKRISSNEEITVSYHGFYSTRIFDERRTKLASTYFFNCTCQACSLKWPLHAAIPNAINIMKFVCDKCKMKITSDSDLVGCASSCSPSDHVEAVENLKIKFIKIFKKTWREYYKFAKEVDFVDAAKAIAYSKCFVRYLKFIEEHVCDRPFRDYIHFQIAAKTCFELLTHNKDVSIDTII